MATIRLPANNWRPRAYQRPAWDYLEAGGRHAELIWHRRSGKDELALHWAAIAAHQRIANYWHMLPRANQVRKAIWEAVNPRTGARRIDEAFPKEIRADTREAEMFIRFKNGSTWQCLGSDNFQGAIGSTPAGIVYSEWAQSNPSARGYLRPILLENGGWQLFITTPRGKNHAYNTYRAALGLEDAFAEKLTAEDTGVFTEDQLARERREYIDTYGVDMGEALFEQEYHCSFEAAILGAYYGAELARVDKEGRITWVEYDPEFPVHTAWDLGYDDDTAIWFYQVIAGEVRLLEYYYNTGKDIDHYAEVLGSKPYEYGVHWLPHDAKAKTLAAHGKSIQEQLANSLGWGHVRIVPRLTVEDGIQAARQMFPRVWFDLGCEEGIEALRQYHREWDDDRKMFRDKPHHDWTSHACLPPDAEVRVAGGVRRIEEIRVGDRVWTPSGLSSVLAAGPVKESEQLVEVETGAGHVLRCTPEHKVFTTRGLVRADALRYTDHLLTGEEWSCRIVSWISTVTGIGFRDLITGETTGRAKARQTSIGPYGSITTVASRRDMTSIMSMAMALTTPSRTWSWWNARSIRDSMHTSELLTEPCALRPRKPWNEQQHGTHRPKDGGGTAGTGRTRGKSENGTRWSVKTAASHFARLFLHAPSGATSIARWKICGNGAGRKWVYDLTVENHASYQANGLLVSNSDAFRYLAVAWQEERVPEQEKVKPSDAYGFDDDDEDTWKTA